VFLNLAYEFLFAFFLKEYCFAEIFFILTGKVFQIFTSAILLHYSWMSV